MSNNIKTPKLPKCGNCKKGMDLVDRITCQKCNNKFCLECRYYEIHKCPIFDRETDLNKDISNAQKIIENNRKYDDLIKDLHKNSSCKTEILNDNKITDFFKSLIGK